MKTKTLLIPIIGISLIMGFSCAKQQENLLSRCIRGKVIEVTCGGTVIQFIDTDEAIGETWKNYFINPPETYQNCVLVGNIPVENQLKGNTLYFNFKKVNQFSEGNFCDIGGLPVTKIEISNLSTLKCIDNEK